MSTEPATEAENIVQGLRQASISAVSAVMRVDVPGDVGYLFLLEGVVVHASTLELEGEPAVSSILSWGEAQLAWCERRWPRERSVHRPWAELVPVDAVETVAVSDPDPDPEPELETTVYEPARRDNEVHFPSSLGVRQALERAELKSALRLASTGNVTHSHGSTAHLKAILRSSFVLGDSLGAALGLGPLLAAEGSAPTFCRLVARSSEDTSAVETSDASSLRLVRAFVKL